MIGPIIFLVGTLLGRRSALSSSKDYVRDIFFFFRPSSVVMDKIVKTYTVSLNTPIS